MKILTAMVAAGVLVNIALAPTSRAEGLQLHSSKNDAQISSEPTASQPRSTMAAISLGAASSRDVNSPEQLIAPESIERPQRLLASEVFDANEHRSDSARPETQLRKQHTGQHNALSEIENIASERIRPALVLRCWQEGRLVIQREIAQMPTAASVSLSTTGNQELRLFDLNNALCLVQSR